MYRLEYLPLARQDMIDTVEYISRELSSPEAAARLAEKLINTAEEKLTKFPYANAAFFPIKPLKREYRKLPIQNYIVFYWVEEEKKLVTVARVVYARRYLEKQLQ